MAVEWPFAKKRIELRGVGEWQISAEDAQGQVARGHNARLGVSRSALACEGAPKPSAGCKVWC